MSKVMQSSFVDRFQFVCPFCQVMSSVQTNRAGQIGKCSSCQKEIQYPRALEKEISYRERLQEKRERKEEVISSDWQEGEGRGVMIVKPAPVSGIKKIEFAQEVASSNHQVAGKLTKERHRMHKKKKKSQNDLLLETVSRAQYGNVSRERVRPEDLYKLVLILIVVLVIFFSVFSFFKGKGMINENGPVNEKASSKDALEFK